MFTTPHLRRRANASLLALFTAAVTAGLSFHTPVEAAPAARPNIVLILADDLGWADVACYGNRFNETPRLDQLAKQGVRFTQFYAGPVCSPTRANIQSGQDQARFGITQHIPGHRRPFAKLIDPAVPLQLPLEVETYAERLREAGYATGYFGKWHLGGDGYKPENQGWQTVVEQQGNTVPAARSSTGQAQRTAEVLTDQAIAFMEANKDRPFVLQLSHFAVHIPLSTTPELQQKYEAKKPAPGYPSRPEYAGLLEELDQSVGRIADAIDRLGLGKNTLLIFTSDNGGLETQQDGTIVTSNQPLRNEKGSLYEGGIRVPAIVRWPGVVPAGSQCGVLANTVDIYPTLLDVTSVSAPKNQPLDGLSLMPVLRNPRATLPRETLYWHLPHYHHSTPASALRHGDWKLIEFFETGALELYDLRQDLGESRNLVAEKPELARELQAKLYDWRQEVGALMPKPNPNYDPARASELANRRLAAPGKAKEKPKR